MSLQAWFRVCPRHRRLLPLRHASRKLSPLLHLFLWPRQLQWRLYLPTWKNENRDQRKNNETSFRVKTWIEHLSCICVICEKCRKMNLCVEISTFLIEMWKWCLLRGWEVLEGVSLLRRLPWSWLCVVLCLSVVRAKQRWEEKGERRRKKKRTSAAKMSNTATYRRRILSPIDSGAALIPNSFLVLVLILIHTFFSKSKILIHTLFYLYTSGFQQVVWRVQSSNSGERKKKKNSLISIVRFVR